MIRAVIFDLDETLYDESQFVRGGFRAVSAYVSSRMNISAERCYRVLIATLEKYGRGKVFDIAMRELAEHDERIIGELVDVYRQHEPELSLYPEVIGVLQDLRKSKVKLGLITDGFERIQRRKIAALEIGEYFECMIISDEFGIDKRKPSVFPYKKAIEFLAVLPGESIYVGDNPSKDFIGAKKLGMHTVRIMRGAYKDVMLSEEYESDHRITTLNDIGSVLQRLTHL